MPNVTIYNLYYHETKIKLETIRSSMRELEINIQEVKKHSREAMQAKFEPLIYQLIMTHATQTVILCPLLNNQKTVSFNHITKLKRHVSLSIFSSPSDKTWRGTLVKNTFVTSWLPNLSISGRQSGSGCALKGRPEGGGGWVSFIIEGGI